MGGLLPSTPHERKVTDIKRKGVTLSGSGTVGQGPMDGGLCDDTAKEKETPTMQRVHPPPGDRQLTPRDPMP